MGNQCCAQPTPPVTSPRSKLQSPVPHKPAYKPVSYVSKRYSSSSETTTALLRKDSISTKSSTRDDMLIEACRDGDEAGFNEVLSSDSEQGIDIDATDSDGRTALAHASMRGDYRIVAKLIILGANVNAMSRDGWSPLHFAVMEPLPCSTPKNHLQTASILLRAGADVDSRSKHGQITPLILAAGKDNYEMVELLLEYDADTSIRDGYGYTALERVNRLRKDPACFG
eukprot:Sspe_Gene.53808::Locus_29708_Transcript_1_1_Confidence_1.000_Length_840::g.53808::m.53808